MKQIICLDIAGGFQPDQTPVIPLYLMVKNIVMSVSSSIFTFPSITRSYSLAAHLLRISSTLPSSMVLALLMRVMLSHNSSTGSHIMGRKNYCCSLFAQEENFIFYNFGVYRIESGKNGSSKIISFGS